MVEVLRRPRCPSCDSGEIRYRVGTNTYLCLRCGNIWSRPVEE